MIKSVRGHHKNLPLRAGAASWIDRFLLSLSGGARLLQTKSLLRDRNRDILLQLIITISATSEKYDYALY